MILQELEKFIPSDEFEAKELQIIKKYIKENPNALTRDNKVAHMTVSAWVTNSTLDKVLMVYHNIYNSWSWLGGHVDGNTDLVQVAMCEAREETGIKELKPLCDTCISVEILPVLAHCKNGKVIATHFHLNVAYAFVADENQTIRPKLDENQAVKWIKVSELNKVVSEKKMLKIYNKIIKRITK